MTVFETAPASSSFAVKLHHYLSDRDKRSDDQLRGPLVGNEGQVHAGPTHSDPLLRDSVAAPREGNPVQERFGGFSDPIAATNSILAPNVVVIVRSPSRPVRRECPHLLKMADRLSGTPHLSSGPSWKLCPERDSRLSRCSLPNDFPGRLEYFKT